MKSRFESNAKVNKLYQFSHRISMALIAVALLIFASCASNQLTPIREKANSTSLETHVEALVFDEKFRNHLDTTELNRTARYIKSQIENHGINCEYQKYNIYGGDKFYRNVICKLDLNKPTTFIIGAHYDVCNNQEGADDNASGVAGLIEAVRLLKNHSSMLNHNIEFVAYTLEEPPYFGTEFMGSFIHANSIPKDEISKYKGMISLEMIGYFTEEGKQDYPVGLKLIYPSHGNFIAAVSDFNSKWISNKFKEAMKVYNNLETQILAAPSILPGVDFSDHRNYWSVGIDAIMITDTAFNRNKNYHKVTDTIETLDFIKMGYVVDGVVTLVLNLEP